MRLNHVAAMLALVCTVAVAQPSAPETAASRSSGSVTSRSPIVPLARFGSIVSLTEVYREAGFEVVTRPELDVTVFRIAASEADMQFPARLAVACAQMAKAAGVAVAPGNSRPSTVLIRVERGDQTFGAPLYDAGRGLYEFGSAGAKLPIPRNADLVQLQPLLDTSFSEVSDVVPAAAVRWEPRFGVRRRLPAMECVLMEALPKDQLVGFEVLPIFVADVRCEPMKYGSATPCYYLVVGQSRTLKAVDDAIDRFRAEQQAALDRVRAEQERQNREAAEAEGAVEQQRVKTATVRISSFRKSLREGVDTNCGPVIQMKLPHVKVYVPVKDYGNEHWIRVDAIYPPGYACTFVNGGYRAPRP